MEKDFEAKGKKIDAILMRSSEERKYEMADIAPQYKAINEPFTIGRPASRLLFDFGNMISCFKGGIENRNVLDLGSGTGWITEWLNRMGYDVTASDISEDFGKILQLRMDSDKRINPKNIHFQRADGHHIPCAPDYFGHICCFDTLHHMHDYSKTLKELYRILIPSGRAIFVEPGAKHSTSKETIEFINQYKKDDPSWIERDVVLEEIYRISRGCGFGRMVIRPSLFPELREYDYLTWKEFRCGAPLLEVDYLAWLKDFNHDSRVVFYLDKGPPEEGTPPRGYKKKWLKDGLILFLYKMIRFLK